MELYFVVRTDIGANEGLQRVFAACDTREQAEDFIVTSLAHLRGDYKVFLGTEVGEE